MTFDPAFTASLDKPTVDDRLDVGPYVNRIVRTIEDAAKNNQLPLTIGVYGRWGSGKTSLKKMVEVRLAPPRRPIHLNQEERALLERQRADLRRVWILQATWALLLVFAGLIVTLGATGDQTLWSGF